MIVRFDEIMNIPSFRSVKLVAGKKGLYKNVSWVYQLQTDGLDDWTQGGELVFVVNNKNIKNILKEAVSKNIAGLVVLKDSNNESLLTDEEILFANKNEIPLFELDYYVKLIDIIKDISKYILNKQKEIDDVDRYLYKLLFQKDLSKTEIYEYFMLLGYQKDQIAYISIIDCVKESRNISKIKQTLQLYMDDVNMIFHSIMINDQIILLVITAKQYEEKSKKLLINVFNILNEKYTANLQMGIGSVYEDIYQIEESYYKALKTFNLAVFGKKVIDYKNLGFSRLLLNTPKEDLQKYLTAVLGKVIEYDKKNDSDFLETLETYIFCNGNISKTAATLFIHRNTCIYRMEKIKNILNIDFEDPYKRADVLNCIMISKYLEEI